jgi:hypothetical protein
MLRPEAQRSATEEPPGKRMEDESRLQRRQGDGRPANNKSGIAPPHRSSVSTTDNVTMLATVQ